MKMTQIVNHFQRTIYIYLQLLLIVVAFEKVPRPSLANGVQCHILLWLYIQPHTPAYTPFT